jgi:hypothetical protein
MFQIGRKKEDEKWVDNLLEIVFYLIGADWPVRSRTSISSAYRGANVGCDSNHYQCFDKFSAFDSVRLRIGEQVGQEGREGGTSFRHRHHGFREIGIWSCCN